MDERMQEDRALEDALDEIHTDGADESQDVESRELELGVEEREQDLVVEHLPRVRAIVQRLLQRLPSSVDREELVHGGVLGLIDAARRFDPAFGCSFASYAEIRIRGAVLDQLRVLDWVPRSVRSRGRVLDRAYREVEQREGRAAQGHEVADELGIDRDRFEALRWLVREAPLHRSDEHWDDEAAPAAAASAMGQWGDPDANPLLALGTGRARQAIADALDELPARERTVVSLLYWDDMSQEAVGRLLGLAESRVRALHVRALLRLRSRLRTLWE
jgi:RNA polymerase sigma factor for flagellar operon FliA